MSETFQSILAAVGNIPAMTITVPKQVNPQFYAHINVKTQQIVGISPVALSEEANDEVISIKIEYHVAEKFLSGVENITRWIARYRNDTCIIVREEDFLREKLKRIDTLSIFEIVDADTPYPDVKIEVGAEEDVVLIYYNGETIKNWQRPAKLYFTAENNPSYLKCAFSLDVNIVDEIQRVNNLPEWPNPIALPLPNADDLSVYTIKSNLKLAIIRHEAVHNRV